MKLDARTGLIVMAFGMVGAGNSLADAPAEPVQPVDTLTIDFMTVDTDADRHLSREEARADPDLSATFEVLDTDRNGSLSPAEFSRWSRAGSIKTAPPGDPATAPYGGSAGAQHVPDPGK